MKSTSAIWISHPTGNANVRAVLRTLAEHNRLGMFFTTIAHQPDSAFGKVLPYRWRREFERRFFPEVPANRVRSYPAREVLRLAHRSAKGGKIRGARSPWGIDAVFRSLDRSVAKALRRSRELPAAVYAYEDGALEQFKVAAERAVGRIYELPIAYWEEREDVYARERERWPDWAPTLIGVNEPREKLMRKSEEIALAETIVCPSHYVEQTIPEAHRPRAVVIPYGCPTPCTPRPLSSFDASTPLRVLFAGAMTQRKGLADLFAAVRSLDTRRLELVVMGSPVVEMGFYRGQGVSFRYEAPRDHAGVLRLMQDMHVLALPSLAEGRALVQLEALAMGLPLIITRNTGGEDLIVPGETGWLIPPGDPVALAERLEWFLDNREHLPEMHLACLRRANAVSWQRFSDRLMNEVLVDSIP